MWCPFDVVGGTDDKANKSNVLIQVCKETRICMPKQAISHADSCCMWCPNEHVCGTKYVPSKPHTQTLIFCNRPTPRGRVWMASAW